MQFSDADAMVMPGEKPVEAEIALVPEETTLLMVLALWDEPMGAIDQKVVDSLNNIPRLIQVVGADNAPVIVSRATTGDGGLFGRDPVDFLHAPTTDPQPIRLEKMHKFARRPIDLWDRIVKELEVMNRYQQEHPDLILSFALIVITDTRAVANSQALQTAHNMAAKIKLTFRALCIGDKTLAYANSTAIMAALAVRDAK